jgi:rare lipoprotein A
MTGSLTRFAVIGLYLSLIGCSNITQQADRAPNRPKDVSNVPNAVPKVEPRSKYGNPSSYKVLGKRYYTLATNQGYHQKGIASWYGSKFHGRRTSSGETYDMYAMTAAHKTLLLPTYVEVTNLRNGRKVTVKVNDRGPFHENRIIDLSYSAAKQLGIVSQGTEMVDIRVISAGEKPVNSVAKSAPLTVNVPVAVYLQLGAFSTSTSAEQFKKKVQSQIEERVVVDSDGKLYRVRVGPLASVKYGDALASRLLELGFNDGHMVVE